MLNKAILIMMIVVMIQSIQILESKPSRKAIERRRIGADYPSPSNGKVLTKRKEAKSKAAASEKTSSKGGCSNNGCGTVDEGSGQGF
ncbi:hypothetical protein PGT21_002310 [Puccinia graminis f. sp. tritici]|uniref:Uncharacterized protein n=2 Tax=Puccinia graminis f. sp. tritici TaxID=56615 RepID=A0A5B0ME09_PUCGR|nr:hypothetical protein PGTUg99_033773 [Puccinia graminis f. sp. tritici]KAA1090472.1 hypothetical protein PGT21_002310 [Puccinia graminis f. sp. tritici]